MEICDCFCTLCDEGYVSSGDECEDDDATNLTHVGQAAYEVLRTKHNRHHHTCWNVTSGKIVGELDQTPRDGWNWNDDPEDGHDDWFPHKLADLMAQTQIWCDLMSLGPPDGLFLDTIKQALVQVAKNAEEKDTPIVVRFMFGNLPGMPVDCERLIKDLTSSLPKDSNIRLWVGAWRRGASWNHAKIIAVDGQHLHQGGHNLWSQHYLAGQPVHDLSMQLQGRCAHDGHLFANEQWAFIRYKQDTICGQFVDKLPDGVPLVAKTRVTVSEYPRPEADIFPPQYRKSLTPMRESLPNEIPIITVGRLGTILKFSVARPSDAAFLAMFNSAKRVIRCAIQDIGPVCIPKTKIPLPGCVWPVNYLECFARALYKRNVDVEIAVSNPQSIPGGCAITEACYGNGWSCVDVAAEIIKTIQKLFPDAEKDALRHIVADNLRVCFVRQKRGRKYNDGMTIGMHAKHFIIDDVCTYVGSQNLYVCDLAEWGCIIDHEGETKRLMDEYWNPMWQSSYTGEDCNVHSVMDGLKVDRTSTDKQAYLEMRLKDPTRMSMHEHGAAFYGTEEKEGEEKKE